MKHPLQHPSPGLRAAAVLFVAALAACSGDPAGPTPDAGERDAADIPIMESFEVQVAADEVIAEVTIEDAALSVSDDPNGGPWAEARELFRQARQAWRAGDTELAAELAEQGRLVLAAAIIERRGEEGLDALFDRVERIVERLGEAPDDFERAAALKNRLEELLDEATVLRGGGDLVGAAERLILGLGITDRMIHRHRDARRNPAAHAKIAVETAVGTLNRVKEEIGGDPAPRVAHALGHATELARRANNALENRAWLRAIVLSRRSIGWSLRALRLSLA